MERGRIFQFILWSYNTFRIYHGMKFFTIPGSLYSTTTEAFSLPTNNKKEKECEGLFGRKESITWRLEEHLFQIQATMIGVENGTAGMGISSISGCGFERTQQNGYQNFGTTPSALFRLMYIRMLDGCCTFKTNHYSVSAKSSSQHRPVTVD